MSQVLFHTYTASVAFLPPPVSDIPRGGSFLEVNICLVFASLFDIITIIIIVAVAVAIIPWTV